MSETDWISEIRRKDARYGRGAFEFVQEALRLAHERAGRDGHVTGKELLEAFRTHALDQFGLLAQAVLAEWGVHSTVDVGRIVFLCVEAGEMGKTDDDSLDDFRSAYDFAEAFPQEVGAVEVARPQIDEDDEEEPDEDV